jgi:hypothetical protein
MQVRDKNTFHWLEKNAFDSRRECNTEHGSLDCWTTTADGFAYGLSSSMVEYCQVLIQLGQLTDSQVCSLLSRSVHSCLSKVSWYNLSRDLLVDELNEYNLNSLVRQLTKDDLEQVARQLLDTVNVTFEE